MDLATLLGLALERGRADSLYHAVAGEVPFRWIAKTVACSLCVPIRSLTTAEATAGYGLSTPPQGR